MKAIGAGTGFLAFLAVALSAEAQVNIEGNYPSHVFDNTSSTTYQATISGVSGCYFKLWVYLGTTTKYDPSQCWVSGSSPFTVSHGVTGMNTWGMQPGNTLDFRGKASTSMVNKDTHDLYRIVENYYGVLPAPDRRSTPSGLQGELYAAVPRNEEELLA